MTKELMAHQIASRALGAIVFVSTIRDPADGLRFAVAYECGPTKWLSRHRFQTVEQAEAGALSLADFLGAEVRT